MNLRGTYTHDFILRAGTHERGDQGGDNDCAELQYSDDVNALFSDVTANFSGYLNILSLML